MKRLTIVIYEILLGVSLWTRPAFGPTTSLAFGLSFCPIKIFNLLVYVVGFDKQNWSKYYEKQNISIMFNGWFGVKCV